MEDAASLVQPALIDEDLPEVIEQREVRGLLGFQLLIFAEGGLGAADVVEPVGVTELGLGAIRCDLAGTFECLEGGLVVEVREAANPFGQGPGGPLGFMVALGARFGAKGQLGLACGTEEHASSLGAAWGAMQRIGMATPRNRRGEGGPGSRGAHGDAA